MADPLARMASRWLRLPPEPQPPAGTRGSVQVFRAAPNYYRFALAVWALRQVGVVVGILLFIGFWQPFQRWATMEVDREVVEHVRSLPLAGWVERLEVAEVRPVPERPDKLELRLGAGFFWVEMLGIAIVAVQALVTYAIVKLDYELRWYIVTDRSLRIREGVTSLHEITLTFANIQNLSIKQGPVQRLLGIADLEVRTAGGGSTGEGETSADGKKTDSMHVGYLRGIDNAADVRDTIRGHLKRLEESPAEPRSRTSDATGAALRVLEEARALRGAVERGVRRS